MNARMSEPLPPLPEWAGALDVWPDSQVIEIAQANPAAFAATFRTSRLDHRRRDVFVDGRWIDFVERCETEPTSILGHAPPGDAISDVAARVFWEREDRQAGRVRPEPSPDPKSDAFLQSFEWKRVRMMVLERDGARCRCCGRTAADGATIHVDHIKPRKRFPQLALDPNNLQVLCGDCNHGKGNLYHTDWRRPVATA